MPALRCAAAFLVALIASPAFAAPVLVGPPERVFDWQADRCERWDTPDAPARAWRDPDGQVRLVAGSEATRASAGPSLDALVRDCAVLHRGAGADDPAAFDDRAWIAAVYPGAGGRIEALAHVEYHGDRRPDRCPAADYAACWTNVVVQLGSEDGGATFRRAAGAGDVVAVLPYPYDGTHGKRAGYFNPSNVLRHGEHLYVYVFAEAYRAQRRGACLLRRPVGGGAADWRAWDGRDFTVRFADPYREAIRNPADHVCTPVRGVASTISSVVRTASGGYLAVTPATRDGQSGVYWTTSADLVTWTKPQLLLAAPLLWRRDCAAPAAYAYPSLIDDDSPSPAFDTADATLALYLVEMPLDAACRIGPRRDLIRCRLSLPPEAAPPREGGRAR